jgi:hypothetical protein
MKTISAPIRMSITGCLMMMTKPLGKGDWYALLLSSIHLSRMGLRFRVTMLYPSLWKVEPLCLETGKNMLSQRNPQMLQNAANADSHVGSASRSISVKCTEK